jgi:aspartyl-tRNA(Asn)/glutamyl-tRNA(Gln) amidotransferase subunit C
MPRISADEVRRIAGLARLSLSDDEADGMARDLDEILGYVEALQGLDTAGIEPTAHAIPLATPMRADEAEPGIDPERVLAGAPRRDGTAFVVPQVIESDEEG